MHKGSLNKIDESKYKGQNFELHMVRMLLGLKSNNSKDLKMVIKTSNKNILLVDILQDRTVWPREEYDLEALERYKESFENLPPIRVDQKTHVLLDGYHRVRVYQELGISEIPVEYEDFPPDRFLIRALELNIHGAPIPRLRRNQVLIELAQQGQTPKEIAKASGLSQASVSKILSTNKRDSYGKKDIFEAIRLVEGGKSLREAERIIGIPKSTIMRAILDAKDRQECIRKHLQNRGGLSSLLCYPERGPWGKPGFKGNCNGFIIVDLSDYFKPKSVFDPMEGSGTTKEVCFDLKVDYEGRDLNSGFDLLSSPLPNRKFDLIFWHPPYWPGFQYSKHPNDFSNAKNWKDYRERIREGFIRLKGLLSPYGHLVILIGNGKKNGVYYSIQSEIIQWDLLPLKDILIKVGRHERRSNRFQYGSANFIPTLHEFVLIFKGEKDES